MQHSLQKCSDKTYFINCDLSISNGIYIDTIGSIAIIVEDFCNTYKVCKIIKLFKMESHTLDNSSITVSNSENESSQDEDDEEINGVLD